MDWDGARNLADLGGLPTVDGERTAYGRVWRSAAPEWMRAAGWRAAREAGLVRVVDLRNDVERGRREHHPVVDEAAMDGVEVVHAPTEDPDDPVEPDAITDAYELGFREAGRHRGHGLGYDPATGEWVTAEDAAWSPEELDAALADRRPVLLQWLSDTDVAGYLAEGGLDEERIHRLRLLLRA